jgi:FkbM family methyltransferase
VRRLYDRWLVSRSPGAWIFNQRTLGWLADPELRAVLPLYLRAFATYCRLQRGLAWHVVGGLRVFRQLVRLRRLAGGDEHFALRIGRHTVFLAAADPRLLQVPNELGADAETGRVLRWLLAEGDTFVDVGANHGSFSIVAAALVGPRGRLYAIEPQPVLARLVDRSLAANAPCRFDVLPVACGDGAGTVRLYVPRDTSGAAGLFPGFSATSAHRVLAVPLRRLDDLLAGAGLPGRVVLKLDVEGNELAVLRGARRLIREARPRVILEMNPHSLESVGTSIERLRGELLELGFTDYVEVDALGVPRPIDVLAAHRVRNVVLLAPRKVIVAAADVSAASPAE